jgi:hypothetical protein
MCADLPSQIECAPCRAAVALNQRRASGPKLAAISESKFSGDVVEATARWPAYNLQQLRVEFGRPTPVEAASAKGLVERLSTSLFGFGKCPVDVKDQCFETQPAAAGKYTNRCILDTR